MKDKSCSTRCWSCDTVASATANKRLLSVAIYLFFFPFCRISHNRFIYQTALLVSTGSLNAPAFWNKTYHLNMNDKTNKA